MSLVIILGDQLDTNHPALRDADVNTTRILMVEALEESTHVWSSKVRSTLFFSAMRHHAEHLRAQGWQVDYLRLGTHPFGSLKEAWLDALQHQADEVYCVETGDHRVAQMLEDVCAQVQVPLRWLPDDHFMMTRADFAKWAGQSKQLRMEMFYRMMRKRHAVLMVGDEPAGGEWNFDAENRKSFGKSGPQGLSALPRFAPDPLTQQAMADVQQHLANHPGTLEDFNWPVTRTQALQALEAFMQHRLVRFGPTQDAMWRDEPFLFHSLISSSLNLKLLNPREVIAAALQRYEQGEADLPSVEGFIRQILGWREFMRGVYHLDMPAMKSGNHLEAHQPLPRWFWTGQTRMSCMQQTIAQTLQHGYAHHIQRLMVTGNFAMLAGLIPQEVCDWYLAVYVDAVEWVELPNTAGMALFALGPRFTTKPYAASGAYIKRMSNYCEGCAYKPDQKTGPQACPMTTLYWQFLNKHQDALRRNPRAALMMKNFDRLDAQEQAAIAAQAAQTLANIEQL
jgi:deoxyribodipyrimidine photolyase-related protein